MEKLPNEDVVEVEKKKNSPEQPVEAEKTCSACQREQ